MLWNVNFPGAPARFGLVTSKSSPGLGIVQGKAPYGKLVNLVINRGSFMGEQTIKFMIYLFLSLICIYHAKLAGLGRPFRFHHVFACVVHNPACHEPVAHGSTLIFSVNMIWS